jgi:hypothetical protein
MTKPAYETTPPRATSDWNGGRHQIGTTHGITSVYPGDFVGIRKWRVRARDNEAFRVNPDDPKLYQRQRDYMFPPPPWQLRARKLLAELYKPLVPQCQHAVFPGANSGERPRASGGREIRPGNSPNAGALCVLTGDACTKKPDVCGYLAAEADPAVY